MIYPYNKVAQLRKDLKGKKVVFATGCFDLVHKGHIEHLENAATHGEVLVVGVHSDKYIRVFKHREPVNTQMERAHLINALKPVTHVILTSFINNKLASTKVLKDLRPNVFFYRGKNIYKPISKDLEKLGIVVESTFLKKRNSTSRIIKKVRELV